MSIKSWGTTSCCQYLIVYVETLKDDLAAPVHVERDGQQVITHSRLRSHSVASDDITITTIIATPTLTPDSVAVPTRASLACLGRVSTSSGAAQCSPYHPISCNLQRSLLCTSVSQRWHIVKYDGCCVIVETEQILVLYISNVFTFFSIEL